MLTFKTIKEKIKHANFHWVNLIAFKLMKPTKRHNKSIVSLETIDLFFSCSLNVFLIQTISVTGGITEPLLATLALQLERLNAARILTPPDGWISLMTRR